MKTILYIILVPAVLAGCKDFKKSIDDTLADTSFENSKESRLRGETISHRSRRSVPDLKTEAAFSFAAQKEKLELAEQQLRNLPQFSGKSIFIYKFIHFYDDGRIITKLQNPENPDFVDEYTYNHGQWETPKPVILSKTDNVESALINLDKIPFKNAGNVYTVLTDKSKEIGSNTKNYTISAGKTDGKITWYPDAINNERYQYDIKYQENGTLISFDQK